MTPITPKLQAGFAYLPILVLISAVSIGALEKIEPQGAVFRIGLESQRIPEKFDRNVGEDDGEGCDDNCRDSSNKPCMPVKRHHRTPDNGDIAMGILGLLVLCGIGIGNRNILRIP